MHVTDQTLDEPHTTGGDADDDGERDRVARRASTGRKVAAAGLAVALVAGGGAVYIRQRTADVQRNADAAAAARAAASTVPPAAERQVATFTDEQTRFSVSYPTSWRILDTESTDESVRLVLSAGGLNSLLVRVVNLEEPVTAANLSDVKAVTDAIVSAGDIEMIQQRSVTLNGMSGYYYLYKFTDTQTAQQGIHAHYFLFQDRRMNILVFQALPADDFDALAPAFDAIASSFRSEPDAEAAPASTAPESTTSTP